MKKQHLFKNLTQKLSYWRGYIVCRTEKFLAKKNQNSYSCRGNSENNILGNLRLCLLKITNDSKHQKRATVSRSMAKSVKTHGGINTVVLGWIHKKRSSVVFAIAVISLTGLLGHKLYNQPELQISTPSPQTFKAPYSTSLEDKQQTEARRKAVRGKSVTVLMVDTNTTKKIEQNLQEIIAQGNEIRNAIGSFPFFDISVLSVSTQQYLRACSDLEWQALLLGLENTIKQKLGLLQGKQTSTDQQKPGQEKFRKSYTSQYLSLLRLSTDSDNLILPKLSKEVQFVEVPENNSFKQALAELDAYRMSTSVQNLNSLLEQISQVRKAYSQAKSQLSQLENKNPETVYKETVILDLSDDDWTTTHTAVRQIAERILTQGIPEGLPPDVLENAVNLHVQAAIPNDAEALANKLLLKVLEPNLKKDEEKTRQQAQQAAEGVLPVIVPLKRGEVIVYKEQKITPWQFEVLEHYQLIRRENNWQGLGKLAVLVTGAIGIFIWIEKRNKYGLRQRDHLLVLLLALSTPGAIAMGIVHTSWSAVGLLLGSFYGRTLGATVVGLLFLVIPISLEISKISLIAGAAGGILASCIAQRLRSREELALLGVAIAATQGSVYLILNLLSGAAFGASWYLVFQEAGLFTLSGLAWSIVALGVSPYLEKLFDLVTPIRLAELANPNRPLLKRLATETPGTFQHTLFVATLAEAAAKQLGCNVELVRAGTLYHDIGKMHDPLGFIENQMGGPNKHETEIQDPWKSAEIIKKHVSEGLAMARKHLLPKAIQAFIPEHQGTMLIAYFYHQAQQQAQADPNLKVDEADFRYDGPIPQSRETGIVMLADACEAALRSLKDVTPEQALTTLNNILRARWQDNQLVDSGLTRDEMSQIAQIFVEVWQQFHHKRIAYPKLKTSNEKLIK
ncbi:HD family phosphohydrolase [Nostoc sp. FACHB-152]|uniref:HD family phosphohydrolase n=1 Tax=unclassified Nostoc TaxID=2593658 RepID=UPI0016860FEE|nr:MULTISPECIES: HD family phosphohydrolase [unclassified Nostoc]MBD2446099.1 HD family phosphohydrolase [Nostoc sp. FACHB-152]MBD2467331.1 HD family phosphohydrolase [Nostoc sp. FACHB-145]